MDVRETIKSQIIGALKNADFPISSPDELLAAFPLGADTTCQAGDLKVTAGDAGKLLKADDFPFKTAEDVGETIVSRAGL
ncbi:hypothetical protein SAMN05446037_103130 [Anaerovirgula multivorans]|uniref:MTH865-like family protein n=1 Tax=Anaerovirgula multivorans TaxID=312168 RepID=A0A239J014_9FIRM|nr:MTH865 family protein [Anaerovirgula multivorans]SNS98004.1 hypothetical protein SAMN05446037_103130 [Anaerovirgula multivorans]